MFSGPNKILDLLLNYTKRLKILSNKYTIWAADLYGILIPQSKPKAGRPLCTTRALIGQYQCFDHFIQTGKFPAKRFFLNNYYFIKELPNGFLCLDNVIQTLGMLLDFRKAKNTRLAACVFLRFSTVSLHPAYLDHVIQTRKTITGISLIVLKVWMHLNNHVNQLFWWYELF